MGGEVDIADRGGLICEKKEAGPSWEVKTDCSREPLADGVERRAGDGAVVNGGTLSILFKSAAPLLRFRLRSLTAYGGLGVACCFRYSCRDSVWPGVCDLVELSEWCGE